MPELPEVEVVRAGMAPWTTGRTIRGVQILEPRVIRRHVGGPADLAARLAGRTITAVSRRGKFLWCVLDGRVDALVIHLGMSGQVLVREDPGDDVRHLRVRLHFDDGGPVIDYVDQRMFGGLLVDELVAVPDGRADERIPASITHIARDLLDPALDRRQVIDALRRRRTQLKRALLDQTLVSGIGNIYADEALWRARLHWATPTQVLTRPRADEVLAAAAQVMAEALAEGGTSFDAQYVNVNGASGYFDRSLAAYGQEHQPCPRCGRAIVREAFTNRSSYRCPRCQPRPRVRGRTDR